MQPDKFIAEVYRRMDMEDIRYIDSIDPDVFLNNKFTKTAVKEYQKVLPEKKDTKILDIGFGGGNFLQRVFIWDMKIFTAQILELNINY